MWSREKTTDHIERLTDAVGGDGTAESADATGVIEEPEHLPEFR